MMHITWKRLRHTPESKPWPIRETYLAIKPTATAFVDHVSPGGNDGQAGIGLHHRNLQLQATRVQQIIRKEGLKTDPAVQTHEDALCLVFLETQLRELVERLGEDKSVDVIQKTLRKMSARGTEAALGLPLDDRSVSLVERALNGMEKP